MDLPPRDADLLDDPNYLRWQAIVRQHKAHRQRHWLRYAVARWLRRMATKVEP